MWPLEAVLLLGSFCCGSAQLLFKKIKSVEFTIHNETVLIPCLITNAGAENISDMYLKWKFKEKNILVFDGYENKSTVDSDFPSAKIEPSELLKGNASLQLSKGDAVAGNYTCEVTELTREGEITIELIYRAGSDQLVFEKIKSVEFNVHNETVLIPCLITNVGAQNIGDIYLKWKFKEKNILVFDGQENKPTVDREFPSAKIEPSELLKGNASLQLSKGDAITGNYTCEVKELTRKGAFTIELKYQAGSAELLFEKIKSVEFNICNATVLIPCLIMNVAAENIGDMHLKWKFKEKNILVFDGQENKPTVESDFPSAKIEPSELLKGNASLQLSKRDAVAGNYTCKVRELTREGEITIELKYRTVSWFNQHENIIIIVFSILTTVVLWTEIVHLALQTTFNVMLRKIVILSIFGFLINILVVVGTIFFIPGEISRTKSFGLYFIVSPLGLLILLQCYKFIPMTGKTPYVIAILKIMQFLGFIVAMVGLTLCVSECVAVHGAYVISGLVIMNVAEFHGLIYMLYMDTIASHEKLKDENVPANIPENIPEETPGNVPQNMPDKSPREGGSILLEDK